MQKIKCLLGIDFYGTIQYWPNELAKLAKFIKDNGGEVYIITACYYENKQKTEDIINASGVPYTAIEWVFFTDEQEVPLKKLKACQKLNIDLYIDDQQRIVNCLLDNGILALTIKGKSKSRVL